MIERPTRKPSTLVRFDSLDDLPPAAPASAELKRLSDSEAEALAQSDPDAGVVPPGFWDNADPVEPESKEQITLRLDPDVLRHFRGTGKGYQSRINAVLKSYVKAQTRTG